MSLRMFTPLACLALTATACIDPESDDDGDGLTYEAETELGTDPELADSDGDGLDDGLEADWGSDPLDADDIGYKAGWPIQGTAFKDDLESRGSSGSVVSEGDTVPRYELRDQFGDVVDLYDFAGHGKPVLFDISAAWCGPCQAMAYWLSTGEALPGYPPFEDEYAELRKLIDDGEVYWVTVLTQGSTRGSDPTREDVFTWEEAFPHPNIPILFDGDQTVGRWGVKIGYPTVMMLNTNMRVVIEDDYLKAFDRATELARQNADASTDAAAAE